MDNQRGFAILVVDDEAPVRNILATYLERRGYVVLTAIDGQEAWECLENQPSRFGLVLTDLTMPRKTGLELIREIKRVIPDLPVLAMSGDFSKWENELKGVTCFPKPFKFDSLVGEIRRHLEATPNA